MVRENCGMSPFTEGDDVTWRPGSASWTGEMGGGEDNIQSRLDQTNQKVCYLSGCQYMVC